MSSPRACPLGLTKDEVRALVPAELMPTFGHWMTGQTMAFCDGHRFNAQLDVYEPSACADSPHGEVVYGADVTAFLAGHPPLD